MLKFLKRLKYLQMQNKSNFFPCKYESITHWCQRNVPPPVPLTECGTVAIQNVERTLCLCQAPCMDTFKGLLHVFQVKEERSGTQWLTPVAWPRATDPSAGWHDWALSALAPVRSPFLDALSLGRDFGWQKTLCLTFSLKILSFLFY